MIGAIDNFGETYISVLQANTNEEVFQQFLLELIEIFDRKDKTWRTSSILVIDNASPHTSKKSRKMYSDLNLPVLFLGPYSYLMAPIELWWGLMKDADLNPDVVPTSKSKFFLQS